VGDELVRFAGRPIRSANQFANILGIYPEGWPVEIVYRRDGAERTRRVRLARLPVRLKAPIATDRGPGYEIKAFVVNQTLKDKTTLLDAIRKWTRKNPHRPKKKT
jgi:hypothetical protein